MTDDSHKTISTYLLVAIGNSVFCGPETVVVTRIE